MKWASVFGGVGRFPLLQTDRKRKYCNLFVLDPSPTNWRVGEYFHELQEVVSWTGNLEAGMHHLAPEVNEEDNTTMSRVVLFCNTDLHLA